jgi:hypothetical protein
MPTTAPKPNQQFAPRIARAIVRIWPAQSREWGQAFAAELPAAQTAGTTVTWLIGGLMLLLREWLKHTWRSLGRPVGSTASDASAAFTPRYSRTPRMPLWLMLTLTLCSIAILLHPEVRQVLRNLSYEYSSEPGWNPDQWSSVKRLRKISKSNRDPQLLALLSLLSKNVDEQLALSDEAINKDPSLTWLDYQQSLLPANSSSAQTYLSKERFARLQQWDPNNGVLHLLAAETLAYPPRVEPLDMLIRRKSKTSREKALIDNPQWASAMHAAFTAPNYDSYVLQLVELIRNVSSRFSVQDPEIGLYVLSMRRIVHIDLLRGYADVLTDRAASLEAAGKTNEAIATYSEMLHFAQQISLDGKAPFEQYLAQQIGEEAATRLAPLYDSTGRSEEASLIRFQLEKWKAERDPKILRYVPLHYRWSQWNSLAWSGLIITVAGFAVSLVIPVTFIALFIVVRRRKTPPELRGPADFWASLCADSAPWLSLASSVLLYVTYHPYARICSAFLKEGDTSTGIESFLSAAMVPAILPDDVGFISDPYFHWVGITTALGVLLVFFLWRMILRSKHSV